NAVATRPCRWRLVLDCVGHMGEEDMRRQQPNVERMRLMGATVMPVDFGTKTLKEATSEAIRDWITNVETTHYLIGSCVGPAPYPEIVAELQSVIGREARAQILAAYVRATDDEALAAVRDLARTEGIVPALEPSHALARARDLDAEFILVGLSGRGDKDLAEALAHLND